MSVRMAQHRAAARRGSTFPVHYAWRKYGEPSVSILGEYDCPDALHKAEIDAIKLYDCLAPKGYNISFGGETAPSKSPDVATKIAAKAKGRKHIDTTPWSHATKERWTDAEYRQKVSDGLKASWDEERRKAASEHIKAMWAKRREVGWSMPESTKQKLAKKEVSAETRAKMSAAAKARGMQELSPEARQKIAEATRKAWQNPEVTERRLSAMKAARNKDVE
jgi:hypothetical protein